MIDDNNDEFQWDYSYLKWQDIPRHVRRQMVLDASQFGRTWMHGRTWVVSNIFKCDARKARSAKKQKDSLLESHRGAPEYAVNDVYAIKFIGYNKLNFHADSPLNGNHAMKKLLITIGLALVASVTYAGPKWRVTRVRPNLWGGMQIEQHDSDVMPGWVDP